MRVLIAGATGDTGAYITHKLAQTGHEPIAMVRESSDTSVLPQDCATRTADLTELPEGLLADVDAVVFAAGSGADTSKEMTRKVDRDGAIALTDVAKKAGIERFVMLSSIGTDAPEQGPEAMQHYLKAKREADDHLRNSGLAYTIVRPVSLTYDKGTGQVELSDHVDHKSSVPREDVANVIAACLNSVSARNCTFEMTSGSKPIDAAIGALEPSPMPSPRSA